MFWLESAEVEGSYLKQKNYHPSSPWCCLIDSVNSMGHQSHGMLGLWCGMLCELAHCMEWHGISWSSIGILWNSIQFGEVRQEMLEFHLVHLN